MVRIFFFTFMAPATDNSPHQGHALNVKRGYKVRNIIVLQEVKAHILKRSNFMAVTKHTRRQSALHIRSGGIGSSGSEHIPACQAVFTCVRNSVPVYMYPQQPMNMQTPNMKSLRIPATVPFSERVYATAVT